MATVISSADSATCLRDLPAKPPRTTRPPGPALLALVALAGAVPFHVLHAQPAVDDPELEVRTVAEGFTTPVSMAFLQAGEFFLLEKNTGRVQRIVDGVLHSTVLDLAVNFASERGLLGIALHPEFPANPSLYLYWTESTTGSDSNVLSDTPLLGNRIDRFLWNGTSLAFDANIVRLRALQSPFPPFESTERGNNNGGVLRFGPDGKLHVFIGDVGRRGWLQNVSEGFGPDRQDDQFGGPEPDNAHLTGVILRLNDDGTAPPDNPFYATGSAIGGELGANIQKIFSYGHRNSFGMAFDPHSGDLWLQENADDAYSEINRVEPGMNSGWVQIMGPVGRIEDYKGIETSPEYFGLQQERWSPESIGDTATEALGRLYMFPGAHYADPVLSWRYSVEPGGLGFLNSAALGSTYEGNLFVGGARDFLEDGHLFRMPLTPDRRMIAVTDPRLDDLVADNVDKWDITESESLLFGRGFGVITDIHTGPNGNLFLVSLSHGAVYEIATRPAADPPAVRNLLAHLSGANEVPMVDSRATGQAIFQTGKGGNSMTFRLIVANIEDVAQAHIHLGGPGVNGQVVAWLYPDAPPAMVIPGRFDGVLGHGVITAAELVGPLAGQPLAALLEAMHSGQAYINVHTSKHPGGEIRGQIRPVGRN
jgi:aldose sugar dehydrogenase